MSSAQVMNVGRSTLLSPQVMTVHLDVQHPGDRLLSKEWYLEHASDVLQYIGKCRAPFRVNVQGDTPRIISRLASGSKPAPGGDREDCVRQRDDRGVHDRQRRIERGERISRHRDRLLSSG